MPTETAGSDARCCGAGNSRRCPVCAWRDVRKGRAESRTSLRRRSVRPTKVEPDIRSGPRSTFVLRRRKPAPSPTLPFADVLDASPKLHQTGHLCNFMQIFGPRAKKVGPARQCAQAGSDQISIKGFSNLMKPRCQHGRVRIPASGGRHNWNHSVCSRPPMTTPARWNHHGRRLRNGRLVFSAENRHIEPFTRPRPPTIA